MLTSQTSSYT
ncbi:hypothetical protein F383_38921 [Gossypium arboreum]|uniref:Uncharacterized protein n=1 Tax=Gossypium arboreum TaxID=29729 RepID=A0A0B0MHT2_GOSAR|nr:hypothetical protein F383_38921 [Gossypium arboreum]